MSFDEERGRTVYTLAELGGLPCMRAVAEDGASALVREVHSDLRNAPVLRWSWRAQEGVKTLDIRQKAGDDLTARVTVNFAFDSDTTSLWERLRYNIARLRYGARVPGSAITYGWANLEPPGTIEPNAYTDRVLTVVLRNAEHVGRGWFDEERNVLEDYRRFFGEEPPSVVGVGIMTDTDDGGGRADACYSDIRFGG